MTTASTNDLELASAASPALMDIAEPDAEFLIATEREQHPQARRRALAVLVTDHPEGHAEETARLVTELLHEADFQVDGALVVRSKKSKIRQAIETAVVGLSLIHI